MRTQETGFGNHQVYRYIVALPCTERRKVLYNLHLATQTNGDARKFGKKRIIIPAAISQAKPLHVDGEGGHDRKRALMHGKIHLASGVLGRLLHTEGVSFKTVERINRVPTHTA